MPDFALVIEAYLALLKLPLSSASRCRLNDCLPALRDEISHLSGWPAERVQGACERIAEDMAREAA